MQSRTSEGFRSGVLAKKLAGMRKHPDLLVCVIAILYIIMQFLRNTHCVYYIFSLFSDYKYKKVEEPGPSVRANITSIRSNIYNDNI